MVLVGLVMMWVSGYLFGKYMVMMWVSGYLFGKYMR
jgi:hypothetical protein